QHLEGDARAGRHVRRAIDRAKPTRRQLGLDAIPAVEQQPSQRIAALARARATGPAERGALWKLCLARLAVHVLTSSTRPWPFGVRLGSSCSMATDVATGRYKNSYFSVRDDTHSLFKVPGPLRSGAPSGVQPIISIEFYGDQLALGASLLWIISAKIA